jgi:hypothetical protein
MNKYEQFNNCKARIQNQLRIHWQWLRKEEDYQEAFKFIECCMNQAVSKDEDFKTDHKGQEMTKEEFNLSDKQHRNAYEDTEDLDNLYDEKDVKEFIQLLKKMPNAEGDINCQCVSGKNIEGGKDFVCDFCINLNKLAGDKLTKCQR